MPSGNAVMFALIFVWLMYLNRICIPASDAVNGSIGEGVKEILNMRTGKLI
jgi:hypothetical protein